MMLSSEAELVPPSVALARTWNCPGDNGMYAIHPPDGATSAVVAFTVTVDPTGADPKANDFRRYGRLAPSEG